jgi:hypothetical protein
VSPEKTPGAAAGNPRQGMREGMGMRLKFDYSKGEMNYHGTEKKGEPWNKETVRGWKLKWLDLIKENFWQHQGKTRALIFWRFILYLPSGACRYFDVILSHSERTDAETEPANEG